MNPNAFARNAGLVLALFALVACSDKAPAPPATEASAAPTPAASVVAAVPASVPADSPIQFEPASLSDCGSGEVVMVRWDASRYPGVSSVKVLVNNGEGGENLFAATGVTDQKETGVWTRAGSEFILRNNDNDAELARVKVPGTPCAK